MQPNKKKINFNRYVSSIELKRPPLQRTMCKRLIFQEQLCLLCIYTHIQLFMSFVYHHGGEFRTPKSIVPPPLVGLIGRDMTTMTMLHYLIHLPQIALQNVPLDTMKTNLIRCKVMHLIVLLFTLRMYVYGMNRIVISITFYRMYFAYSLLELQLTNALAFYFS